MRDVNKDQDDTVLLETLRNNNSQKPIIEFKPSSKFTDFDNQINIQISNSSKAVKNANKSNVNNYTDSSISKSDTVSIRKHSPSMIEVNKFQTLNNISIRRTTFIEDPKLKLLKTRNYMNYEIISKFNTHKSSTEDSKNFTAKKQAEGNEKSTSHNRNFEYKKKPSVYDYKQQSLRTYDLTKTQKLKGYQETLTSEEDQSTLKKDSDNKKNTLKSSRIPKVSKPTKTIKMNISGDDNNNLKLFENSLRSSKDSVSLRGSMASK